MKILINTLLVFGLFQFSLSSNTIVSQDNIGRMDSSLVISSVININGIYKFSVYDPSLKRRFWITSGKVYNGYTFLSYDKINSSALLSKNDSKFLVPIIKSSDRPIEIVIHELSEEYITNSALPTTAEIEAYRQHQYKNLPDPKAKNYKLHKISADNRIYNFSIAPIENLSNEAQIGNPIDNATSSDDQKLIHYGGRTQKTKVGTTTHSSVFQESQKKAKN